MTTAAGGTHPTGMHSCHRVDLQKPETVCCVANCRVFFLFNTGIEACEPQTEKLHVKDIIFDTVKFTFTTFAKLDRSVQQNIDSSV